MPSLSGILLTVMEHASAISAVFTPSLSPLTMLSVLPAAGVWGPVPGCGGADSQCGAPWRQHWLLPVAVPFGLLYLSPGYCCNSDNLGHKRHCQMDSGGHSPAVVLMGLCAFHRRLSTTGQTSACCLPPATSVHLHGLAGAHKMSCLRTTDLRWVDVSVEQTVSSVSRVMHCLLCCIAQFACLAT